MPDTLFLCNLSGSAEGMDGCGLKVLHLIAGEETREVEWGVGKAVLLEPAAHLTDHVHIVVDGGNDEVGELYPHASPFHGKDSVEDRLQMATTDPMVDVVAKRLEVDIGGIKVGQEVGERFLTDVASRDEDIPQSFLMGQTGTVRHIFYISEGLGVGVGDARTMMLQTEADQLLRGEVVVVHIVWVDL